MENGRSERRHKPERTDSVSDDLIDVLEWRDNDDDDNNVFLVKCV